jgi:hypothetical protein
MPAGLVQLIAYGAQDLFLTGVPEITFFRVVYRRYTNFAIESINVPFDDEVDFDLISSVELPKTGDLIHKTYLEINVPQFYYTRSVDASSALAEYQTALSNFQIVWKFMNINMLAYRNAYNASLAENVTTASILKTAIFDAFGNASRSVGSSDPSDPNVIIVTNFNSVISSTKYKIRQISVDYIAYDISDVATKATLMNAIRVGYNRSFEVSKYFMDIVVAKKTIYLDESNTNYNFAWVERLGHAIIDYIEIYIGGDVIDRHFGDWLNIWYELTCERDIQDIYYKMIGNVDSLTTFDRTTKPAYKMLIPLQFWFCRNNGLSLPMCALQFSDVSIKMKLKKFSDCAYIESGSLTDTTLDALYENNSYHLTANLLIDYIFLDEMERKKFAQSAHEYLIEQLQIYSMENITETTELYFNTDFSNPVKELIWVGQKYSFINNSTGYVKCRWDNYTDSITNTGNPITYSEFELNGTTRVNWRYYFYFNYVQPYQVHNTTPSDGINIYSFAIDPEDHQPSGTCNLSRMKTSALRMRLSSNLVSTADGGANIRVYAVNYNVLRFLSGYGGLAYV